MEFQIYVTYWRRDNPSSIFSFPRTRYLIIDNV
nr:MAG TPA: hypothetical protein [Caudoviricetes sp.]